MRKTGAVMLVVGLLLVAGAAVLRFAIVPASKQLPGNTNETRTFAGTASVVLNPQAVAAGDFTNAVLRDAPINVDRTVTVDKTDGSAALVQDRQVVTSDATKLATYTWKYSLDRKSMVESSTLADQASVVQKGITISWPMDTAKKDYTGWVAETHTTVPLKYTGTSKVDGLTTYDFTSSVPTTLITDTQSLAGLPTSAPKAMLASLAPALGLSADTIAQMSGALAALPDPVPLSYLYASDATYQVEPATGLVVGYTRNETRSVALTMPGASAPTPVAPVLQFTAKMIPTSVDASISDAKSARSLLFWLGSVVPITGGLLGLALIGMAPFVRRTTPEIQIPVERPMATT